MSAGVFHKILSSSMKSISYLARTGETMMSVGDTLTPKLQIYARGEVDQIYST